MRRIIGFLPAALLSTVVAPQAPSDPFEACAQKTDASARLACFDQEMQRRHDQGATRGAQAGDVPAAVRPQRAPPAVQGAGIEQGLNTPQGANARRDAGTRQDTASSRMADKGGSREAQQRYGLHVPNPVKEPPPPLVAQVAQFASSPDHRYTLVLDNGQVWEQVESQPGMFVRAHETVTISSGALGAFILENARHQYVRVRRVH